MIISFDTHVVKSGKHILTIDVRHNDLCSARELLNMLNNVDTEGLRYSPENMREANMRKEVLLKQLEAQWSGNLNVLSHIIHPDSTYMRKVISIRNHFICDSCLYDGDYSMLYLAPKSKLMCYEYNILNGNKPICEYDLFQCKPTVIGGSSDVIVCFGDEIRGIMFLVERSEDWILDMILVALNTGNFTLFSEKKGALSFVFLNTLYAVDKERVSYE